MSKKGKRGRKSKWETHVEPRLFEIKHWCREGLIEEEIYKRLGISKDSFYRYKAEYSELSDTLNENKAIADFRVEDSLYKRALGYEYKEVTIDKDGNKEIKIKQQAPDTTAQIFWLKNRRPDIWRDKKEIDAKVTTKLEDFFTEGE